MWNNIGVHYQINGNYFLAQTTYQHALAVAGQMYEANHPAIGTMLNNLGNIYLKLGDLGQAKEVMEQALGILDKQIDGLKLNNLGQVYHALGELGRAQELTEHALALDKQIYGEQHPATARDMNNLGQILRDMGKYTKAKSYMEQAIQIAKNVYGEEHPTVALYNHNLGQCLWPIDLDTAITHTKYALDVFLHQLGETHPLTQTAQDNMKFLLRLLKIRKTKDGVNEAK